MKSMKKLVLVGLVLLASVMVLVGCKMEPEVPPAKLDSITSLVQSAFNTKDEIGDTMMIVVTYDNGTTKTVKGTIISDSSELTQSHGLNKEVTVSYSEGGITKEATFTIDVASYKFTETVQNYEYPEGKTGTASTTSSPTVENPVYKKFGDYPQTIKDGNVTIGSGRLSRGDLVYQVGTDGNYYVQAGNDYYKVEPIVWRVLTNDYEVSGENRELKSTGQALLLAENILTGGIQWDDDKNNYMESRIRKWLNGNSGSGEQSDYSGDAGFLQTAFTEEARDQIADTKVDNSARSTNPDSNGEERNSGKNEYACDNTIDKIFLLSEQEATMSDYGFGVYDAGGQGNTRIRVTTDYAEATGAIRIGTAGGWWWLRSPNFYMEVGVSFIYSDGNANRTGNVNGPDVGIVPALSISMNGN